MIDATGLTGAFDITLNVDTGNFLGSSAEFADFVNSTLERQFGLKLERRKMPLDTLVVDRGNTIPAEN
jgi:uncharacterized protein (TIGR03435 family)